MAKRTSPRNQPPRYRPPASRDLPRAAAPIDEMVAILKAHGYEVTRAVTYGKHTFEVEATALRKFFELQASSGLKVKEAISEAVLDWVAKHGPQATK